MAKRKKVSNKVSTFLFRFAKIHSKTTELIPAMNIAIILYVTNPGKKYRMAHVNMERNICR